jgi:hypothetical protein
MPTYGLQSGGHRVTPQVDLVRLMSKSREYTPMIGHVAKVWADGGQC